MTVTKVISQESATFTTIDLPTSPNTAHQYTIDWESLSLGQEGVTVQVDSDGDGTFESTIAVDNDLTQAEYLSATGEEEEGVPIWLWPVVGFMGALLLLLVAVIYRLKFKQPAV